MDDNKYQSAIQKWSEIKDKIEGQLENMGFDMNSKKDQIKAWKNYVYSPFLVIGHGMNKLGALISSLGAQLQTTESKNMKQFLKDVKEAFEQYLQT